MATSYKSDLVKIYHSLGRKKRLGTVIFFVTSRLQCQVPDVLLLGRTEPARRFDLG